MASTPLIRKKAYQEYVDKYGKDTRFFVANRTLMQNLLFNRRLRNNLKPLIDSRFSVEKTSSYSYSAAYASLKNIDIFLRDSGAMSVLSDFFYDNQPISEEIYSPPIFIRGKEEDIINMDQYPTLYSETSNDALSRILLFSRTAFYSNKVAKFVDAMQEKTFNDLGFSISSAPRDLNSHIAIDDFFMSPEFNNYLSAIMMDADSPEKDKEKKLATKLALKNYSEAIKRGNFDKRFRGLVSEGSFTKLDDLLTLWASHQALYSIKNLAITELLKSCIEWNKNEEPKIQYNIHPTENYNYKGISFDIPYSNTPLTLHIPTNYLEKNIFPILSQENIDPSTIITPNPPVSSATLYKSLSKDEVENVRKMHKKLPPENDRDYKYRRFIEDLNDRIDRDMDF